MHNGAGPPADAVLTFKFGVNFSTFLLNNSHSFLLIRNIIEYGWRVQTYSKENTKAPHYWPFRWKSNSDQWIPHTKGQLWGSLVFSCHDATMQDIYCIQIPFFLFAVSSVTVKETLSPPRESRRTSPRATVALLPMMTRRLRCRTGHVTWMTWAWSRNVTAREMWSGN